MEAKAQLKGTLTSQHALAEKWEKFSQNQLDFANAKVSYCEEVCLVKTECELASIELELAHEEIKLATMELELAQSAIIKIEEFKRRALSLQNSINIPTEEKFKQEQMQLNLDESSYWDSFLFQHKKVLQTKRNFLQKKLTFLTQNLQEREEEIGLVKEEITLENFMADESQKGQLFFTAIKKTLAQNKSIRVINLSLCPPSEAAKAANDDRYYFSDNFHDLIKNHPKHIFVFAAGDDGYEINDQLE